MHVCTLANLCNSCDLGNLWAFDKKFVAKFKEEIAGKHATDFYWGNSSDKATAINLNNFKLFASFCKRSVYFNWFYVFFGLMYALGGI